MLLKGYKYSKLEKIKLEYDMLNDLRHLKHLPFLKEFIYEGPFDLDIETLPTDLVYLRKLKITLCGLRNLSYLCHFSALEEVDLAGCPLTKIERIPTALFCLRNLILQDC